MIDKIELIPVLPLRDVVVYPYMVVPLFVGRKKSMNALDQAMLGSKQIILVAQKHASDDSPEHDQIYKIGTLGNILQLIRLPDNTIKVLVEGIERVSIKQYKERDDMLVADVEILHSQIDEPNLIGVHVKSTIDQLEQYAKLNKNFPSEVFSSLSSYIDDPSRLADVIATHVPTKIESKQRTLEILSVKDRLENLMQIILSEIDVIRMEKRIRGRIKSQMEKSQREYYLNEQMKAIQKELGDDENALSELEMLERKIEKLSMPKEAKTKAKSELSKLKMMSPMSAEATVVRNYIDWLLQVPWKSRQRLSKDIMKAQRLLDEDHYGLEKVKERILEYLAIQQRISKPKGAILCLVGPPGVGKTSLGRSIARATNRRFVRMSLGGVRDEAEIRGHRRTYIGAMPGKIIQSISKSGKKNPLFLLDEIDKMAMDFRGDPASALLEVLDPEQNHTFSDHYIEVDYDLSEVMFVATANSLNIPSALLDRIEVIRISGYTEEEKINIAKRYLIPQQIVRNGLKSSEISFRKAAIQNIIRYYTREAGVRNLDREIAKICRKIVKQILLDEKKQDAKEQNTAVITAKRLEHLLGVRRFRYGKAEELNRVGQVTGLAWTQVGGDLLTIEATTMAGRGKIIRTGKLGDVMKESVEAAMTVVKSRSDMLGIAPDCYKNYDFHIHVPEGAIPKDGPSAGVAMCTALISSLCNIPVKSSVAMTGEITLRGEILPIGGLKEKLLAAMRGGIEIVLIPKENVIQLAEIPENIKQHITIKPVQWIDQLLALALEKMPAPQIIKPGKLIKDAKVKRNVKNDLIRPH